MNTTPLPTAIGSAPIPAISGVYLVHLDEPYFHARHYVGYADDIARRIETHHKGRGSPLLAAATAAGIGWVVVQIWPGGDRRFERKLHNRHGSRLCPEPECRAEQRRRRLQLRLPLECRGR
jgi:hypothetical protein